VTRPMNKSKILSRITASFVFLTIGILIFPSTARSQCTSCGNCPPPAIGFTSKQMSVNGNQVLTAIGGMGPYTWSLVSGGGNLPSSGTSVTYTAPATNPMVNGVACSNNPTIQVTDSCGNKATLKIAVNQYNAPNVAASSIGHQTLGPPDCISSCDTGNQLVLISQVNKAYYNCAGSLISDSGCAFYFCRNYSCGVDSFGPTGCANGCYCNAPDMCDSECYPGRMVDKRTSDMLSRGCCPAALSTCVGIAAFTTDVNTINLSAGQTANLTGTLQINGGGTTNWTIYANGRAVKSGTGTSVSHSWDGKDIYGKQFDAGTYQVVLDAQTTGGTCGNDSDTKTLATNVTVTATPTPDACQAPGTPSTQR